MPAGSAIQLHRANITLAHQQNPDPALRALPLDLERRWYGHAGLALSVAV